MTIFFNTKCNFFSNSFGRLNFFLRVKSKSPSAASRRPLPAFERLNRGQGLFPKLQVGFDSLQAAILSCDWKTFPDWRSPPCSTYSAVSSPSGQKLKAPIVRGQALAHAPRFSDYWHTMVVNASRKRPGPLSSPPTPKPAGPGSSRKSWVNHGWCLDF